LSHFRKIRYGRPSNGLMVFTPSGLKWRSFLVRRIKL
jgi:hypothetical protein